MEVITNLDHIQLNSPTAVTVGKFDGIHTGHHLLAQKVVLKKEEGFIAVVITFESSMRAALQHKEDANLITREERIHILESLGVDYLIECQLTDKFLHTSPEEFINQLCEKLHMKYMVSGSDFTFGYKGLGNTELLSQLAEKLDFKYEIVTKLKKGDRDISSTYIREEIAKGNIDNANDLLGYPYFIYGEIVHGNHIGTGMGIPTINMMPPSNKLLPPNGVYVTRVTIDQHVFHGASNIGVKPTIDGIRDVNVETFIMDFNRNVYDKNAKVEFLTMLRSEKKFDSLDQLKKQILIDIEESRKYFNN